MTGRSLEKVKIEKAGIKGSLSAIQLDVTDKKSIEQAATPIQEYLGLLHILVNNAVVGSRDPDIEAGMQLCMETNLIGPAVVAAAFRPLLLKA